MNTLKSTTDAVIEKLQEIMRKSGSQNDVEGINLKENKASNDIDLDMAEKQLSLQNESITKCQIPGLEYVVFVKGSGPHEIDYGYFPDKPPKEVLVSRKCAEAVLRGAQVQRIPFNVKS